MLDSKVLQVFYDEKCYPFKDKERSVRFPIIGNSFVGASNVTEIRFYIDRIGSHEDSWVANSKLPNGKMGNQLITTYYDSEVEEYYAKLNLTSFYTQAKGDVYISLNGFYGGVSITQHNGVYQISGIPTIQATGSIKLSVYYATPLIDSDEISAVTLSQVLAEIATKLERNNPYYLKVVSNITAINNSTYADYLKSGDVVYSKYNHIFYVLGGTHPSLTYTILELNLDDVNLAGDITVQGDALFNGEVRVVGGSTYLTFGADGLVCLQDLLDEKQDVIPVVALSTTSGTISNTNILNSLAKFPSYLTYEYGGDKSVFIHARTDGTYHYFRKLFKESIHDNTTYLIYGGDIYIKVNKSTGAYSQESVQYTWYSKSQMDTLLNAKADKSDTYTKSEIDTKLTSMLVYKGTLTVAQINALDTSTLKTGWFCNVSDSGVLTVGNIEVLQGDNICWTGSGWDKLTMDLSAYDDKFIAAGFFEVQDYNENTGEITFVYASDLYNMSYDTSTGVLTITAS